VGRRLEADSVAVNTRPATSADVSAITEIYNEAIAETTATFDLEPKTTADREAWLSDRDPRFPVIVAETGGRVVGWAALAPWSDRAGYADTAESAMYVHSGYRNRGIGRQLKRRIIELARHNRFHTLLARVTAESEASVHLNVEFGFEHVGTLKQAGRKFGRLLDVHIMQKILD
jgi:L-amino acid N-acyltransferase YncA